MFHRQSLGKPPWLMPKSKRFNLFKVKISPSKNNCIICYTGSPLKMMKNAFYFILKALFVLQISKFLWQLFCHVGKTTWLEKFTSKFMTSQPGLQTIVLHILPNISKNKNNQTMKFGQLLIYNKIIIFL